MLVLKHPCKTLNYLRAMTNQFRIILLWLILVVCMVLHFDYHVSELFYGIEIRRPDANGRVPSSVLYIRSAFHFLPFLYISVVMWFTARPVRIINLLLSVLYLLAHIAHLAGELKKGDNPSQMVLLSITAFLSSLAVIASWKWLKETEKQVAAAQTANRNQ